MAQQLEIYGNPAKYKAKKIISGFFLYLFLIIVAVIVLLPFYMMVLTSLKTESQFEASSFIWWLKPSQFQWNNYRLAFEKLRFWKVLRNTVLVALISTFGTVITTVLAAFAFARLSFKGRDLVFALLLTTMMIPGELFTITNYITVSRLGWLGSGAFGPYGNALAAMTIPFMTSVFYIYFLRQNFKTIPNELYYAAKVDGTHDFGYLMRVMIPIASPTIISIIILNAMGTWNAYIWPSLVIANKDFVPVTVALRDSSFQDETGQKMLYTAQMAGATLVTAPLLVIFFALKKYIMRGVSRSGIKG